MNEQNIKLAAEIAELRERESMTFKAIGERYQLTPGKASYLYQDHLRRRRIARYREIHEEQNQINVSVSMTLGEIAVLRRILSLYQIWALRENSRRAKEENPLFEEPDYVTAEYLNRRFAGLEKEKRQKARGNKDLFPESIDIFETG